MLLENGWFKEKFTFRRLSIGLNIKNNSTTKPSINLDDSFKTRFYQLILKAAFGAVQWLYNSKEILLDPTCSKIAFSLVLGLGWLSTKQGRKVLIGKQRHVFYMIRATQWSERASYECNFPPKALGRFELENKVDKPLACVFLWTHTHTYSSTALCSLRPGFFFFFLILFYFFFKVKPHKQIISQDNFVCGSLVSEFIRPSSVVSASESWKCTELTGNIRGLVGLKWNVTWREQWIGNDTGLYTYSCSEI